MFIHHIGYAVRSISDSIPFFESLGFQSEGDVYVDIDRSIYIHFMINGNYKIELVESLDTLKSDVKNYILKNGNIPYHICYMVESIDEKIKDLKNKRFKLIKKPQCAIALEGEKVAFLYHKNVGLIELLEKGR